MRDWTNIATFDGIDLTESFVISWSIRADGLVFEVDFVLLGDHPEYRKPHPNEWACFRRGTLLFPDVRSLTGLPPMNEVRPALGPTGEADYGSFDSFVEVAAGRFRVIGDFGSIYVESDPPQAAVQSYGL